MNILVTGGAGYTVNHTVEDMCRSSWLFASKGL